MTAAAKALYYQADPTDAYRVEPLDSMVLIYHRPSGITHMVTEPVPEILAAMGIKAVSATEIAEQLKAVFDLGDAAQAELAIAARLAEMAEQGLIAKCADNRPRDHV